MNRNLATVYLTTLVCVVIILVEASKGATSQEESRITWLKLQHPNNW